MIDTLKEFEPITLDEMSGIRLMNRTDTKFVTTEAKLQQLLRMAAGDYYVQEIDGRRLASYYTLYFDTGQCDMFRAHHNGKKNRQKLRIRSYMDSQLDFLEVKTKNNHGRTKKKRVPIGCFDHIHTGRLAEICGEEHNGFLADYLWYDPLDMGGKIENSFSRITLVNKAKTERLTIDLGLKFHNLRAGCRISLDGLVIIELKRDGCTYSPVTEMLRSLRIRPMGFSKYCMGMAMTDDNLRKNLFIKRINRVRKIINAQ